MPRILKILKYDAFVTSGDLNFDPSEKNDRSSYEVIFDELSNVFLLFYFYVHQEPS